MEFEAAKCPDCGAAIQVSLEYDEATCQYCGTHISVQEAVEHAVDPAMAATAANLVVRARQCMTAQDFRQAYRFFTEALDHQAMNEAAWQGCLLAVSRNLTKIDYAWAPFTGAAGIPSVVFNYLRCTPRSRKKEAASFVERLAGLLRDDIGLVSSMETAAQRRTGIGFLLAFVFALLAFLTLVALALPFTLVFGLAAVALAARSGILLSRQNRSKALITQYPIEQLKSFLSQIEEVLAGETRPA
jgi:hypothetical protein